MTGTGFTRAALSVGETSTEYVRAGQGSTALLLVAGGAESALSLRVVAVLSRWWRVIAPKWSAGAVRASTLEEFIEGLGIAPTAIVADGEFCAAALELAAAADGVTVVALLTSADEASTLEAAARRRIAGRRVTVIVRPVPAIDTGLTAFAQELLEAMDSGTTRTLHT